jgi:hypothetical protein
MAARVVTVSARARIASRIGASLVVFDLLIYFIALKFICLVNLNKHYSRKTF